MSNVDTGELMLDGKGEAIEEEGGGGGSGAGRVVSCSGDSMCLCVGAVWLRRKIRSLNLGLVLLVSMLKCSR